MANKSINTQSKGKETAHPNFIEKWYIASVVSAGMGIVSDIMGRLTPMKLFFFVAIFCLLVGAISQVIFDIKINKLIKNNLK